VAVAEAAGEETYRNRWIRATGEVFTITRDRDGSHIILFKGGKVQLKLEPKSRGFARVESLKKAIGAQKRANSGSFGVSLRTHDRYIEIRALALCKGITRGKVILDSCSQLDWHLATKKR